jgi:hypothetical protein
MIDAKYARQQACAPELRTASRPGTQKLATLRSALKAKEEAETAALPAPRPAPAPPAVEVPVTAATVLRETAVVRRKQAEEAAALQRFEVELRDDSAFAEWQARMQAFDDANECDTFAQHRTVHHCPAICFLLEDAGARDGSHLAKGDGSGAEEAAGGGGHTSSL